MRIQPSITEAYFVKLFRGARKNPQTHKKITRSQHMLKKHIITMLMGQVNAQFVKAHLVRTKEAVHLKDLLVLTIYDLCQLEEDIQCRVQFCKCLITINSYRQYYLVTIQ